MPTIYRLYIPNQPHMTWDDYLTRKEAEQARREWYADGVDGEILIEELTLHLVGESKE